MKSWIVVAVVGVAFGAALGVSCYTDPSSKDQKNTPNQVGGAVVSVASPEKRSNATQDSKGPPCWEKFFTWPEGITTLAILATLLAIVWQSSETRSAAQGALLSAQAAINAERAWVVMVIEPDKESPKLFQIKAENRGRTPAEIIFASHECAVVTVESEMPEIPEYTRNTRFKEGVFLFAGESQLIAEFSRDHLRVPSIGEERNGGEQFERVKNHQALAIIFGNVIYRDLLAPRKTSLHETRWCGLLKLGEDEDECFLTRGRDGYTKHT